MPGLLDFLNPVKGIVDTVRGVVAQFVPDPQAKLQIGLELAKLDAQVRQSVAAAEQAFADAQARVIVAEATGDSWLARNWRPVTMLVFVFIVLNNYVLRPLVGTPPVDTPPEMWSLLKLGLGGYIGARTLEKIGPALISAVTGKAAPEPSAPPTGAS